MPIAITVTEGVFTPQSEQRVFDELSQSFLKAHDLAGNPFMTPNVIGDINVLPKGKIFSGGKPENLVIVELKVPSFALSEPAQKSAWVAEATDIVLRASEGRVARERVYINMVYAVEGLWGIGGKAYTNPELIAAVQGASAS
jgi:hypothetical protein